MDRFEQNFAELQKVLRDRCVALKFPDNPMTKIKQGWGDWGAQAASSRFGIGRTTRKVQRSGTRDVLSTQTERIEG